MAGTVTTAAANNINIVNGTASLDVAAGAAVNVDANLTVETASTVNQDLTSDASPTFAGATLSGVTASRMAVFDGSKAFASGTNTDTDVADAVTKKHTQGTDTALSTVGTKNPPIDADLAIYRDSAASNVLVTSTWTQVKAFLKTYFDTVYHIVGGALGTPSSGDKTNLTGQSNVTAPAEITSFAGTISASGTTATFTEAADYNLCAVGSTIRAAGATKYVCKLLGSLQVTLDGSTTWAASTAITGIQGYQKRSDPSGTAIAFTAANGSKTVILTSDGSILFHRTVDGTEGIGTTAPIAKLHIAATNSLNPSKALVIRDAAAPTYGFDFDCDTLTTGNLNIRSVSAGTSYEAITIVRANGNVGITETAPTISDGFGLHLGGKIIRIATSKTPASAGAAGNTGEICWDGSYVYVCVATNSWTRTAIAAW